MGTKMRDVARRIEKKLLEGMEQEEIHDKLKAAQEARVCRFCERQPASYSCCDEAKVLASVLADDADAKKLWDMELTLWKAHRHTDHRFTTRRFWYEEARCVTPGEFRLVKLLAPKYIVEPTNACMGFNFGINIFAPMMTEEEEDFALNHGSKLKVIPLLSLTGKHFDTRFEETWKKLSPLSHNKKNAAKLKKYGFEELKSEGHYDY